MIETLLTLQSANKNLFINSLQSSEIHVTVRDVRSTEQLSTVELVGFNSTNDIRFVTMVAYLKDNRIAFSLEWKCDEINEGGETHFRVTEFDEQFLSWTDCQKHVVDIESVRDALLDGETRLFELLDSTEGKFIPWDWSTQMA